MVHAEIFTFVTSSAQFYILNFYYSMPRPLLYITFIRPPDGYLCLPQPPPRLPSQTISDPRRPSVIVDLPSHSITVIT